MPDAASSESMPILIEFSPRPGVEAVAIWDKKPEELKKQLKEKSEEALDKAMKNIEEMADRVNTLQKRLPFEFS